MLRSLPATLRRHALPIAIGSVVAVLLTGTATVAATVITSLQIKDGTIRNVDIARGTISADRLTAAARASLRGQRGAVGPAGAQGVQGVQGIQGIPGEPGEDGSLPDPGVLKKWVISYDENPDNLNFVTFQGSTTFPVGTIIQPLGLEVSPGTDFSRCNGTGMGDTARIGVRLEEVGGDLDLVWSGSPASFKLDNNPGRKSGPSVVSSRLRVSLGCPASLPPPPGEVDPIGIDVPVPSVDAVFYFRVFHEDPILAFDKTEATAVD